MFYASTYLEHHYFDTVNSERSFIFDFNAESNKIIIQKKFRQRINFCPKPLFFIH